MFYSIFLSLMAFTQLARKKRLNVMWGQERGLPYMSHTMGGTLGNDRLLDCVLALPVQGDTGSIVPTGLKMNLAVNSEIDFT